LLVWSFDEFGVLERGAGMDKGKEVRSVHCRLRAPAESHPRRLTIVAAVVPRALLGCALLGTLETPTGGRCRLSK